MASLKADSCVLTLGDLELGPLRSQSSFELSALVSSPSSKTFSTQRQSMLLLCSYVTSTKRSRRKRKKLTTKLISTYRQEFSTLSLPNIQTVLIPYMEHDLKVWPGLDSLTVTSKCACIPQEDPIELRIDICRTQSGQREYLISLSRYGAIFFEESFRVHAPWEFLDLQEHLYVEPYKKMHKQLCEGNPEATLCYRNGELSFKDSLGEGVYKVCSDPTDSMWVQDSEQSLDLEIISCFSQISADRERSQDEIKGRVTSLIIRSILELDTLQHKIVNINFQDPSQTLAKASVDVDYVIRKLLEFHRIYQHLVVPVDCEEVTSYFSSETKIFTRNRLTKLKKLDATTVSLLDTRSRVDGNSFLLRFCEQMELRDLAQEIPELVAILFSTETALLQVLQVCAELKMSINELSERFDDQYDRYGQLGLVWRYNGQFSGFVKDVVLRTVVQHAYGKFNSIVVGGRLGCKSLEMRKNETCSFQLGPELCAIGVNREIKLEYGGGQKQIHPLHSSPSLLNSIYVQKDPVRVALMSPLIRGFTELNALTLCKIQPASDQHKQSTAPTLKVSKQDSSYDTIVSLCTHKDKLFILSTSETSGQSSPARRSLVLTCEL